MSSPHRIAFGITDLDVGGAERTLVELVVRLDRRRWDPHVVCLQPAGALAERLRQADVPVRSLDMRSWLDLPRAVWQWTHELRRRRPELLQTFLFHANVLGRIAAKLAGMPPPLAGVRVAERRAGWHVRLDRLTRSLGAGYVCVSKGAADFTQERIGAGADQIFVVPNGVDVAWAADATPVELAPFGGGPGRTTLVFVGRLDEQKGLPDLASALEVLMRQRPLAEKLLVLLVGEGPGRHLLERRFAESCLTDVVKLVGWQPRPQDWLAAADGFLLPSRWEGMPNAVLEAMAAGLPVIATNVEGTAELVLPGETGWLTPVRDPGALAVAIADFLDNPERHASMGAAAKSRVAEHFTFERMVERYEEIWERRLHRPA